MLPEYRKSVKALVQEAIRTNGIYKSEYPVKWKDGSIHWILAHGRPRYDDESLDLHYHLFSKDIIVLTI